MSACYLSPFFGAAPQFFNNQGAVLAGGKLYTYTAGTSTPNATYTSSTGGTPNANPLVLDSAGRTTQEVWLSVGVSYKFILQDASSNVLGTYDNISGINDTAASGGSVEATGPVAVNAAGKATLSEESGGTLSRVTAFGVDNSTFGTLQLNVAKANGSSTNVVSVTSAGAAVAGALSVTGAVTLSSTLNVGTIATAGTFYTQTATGTAPNATPINIFSTLTSGGLYLVAIGSGDNNVRCLYYVFYNGGTVGIVALETSNFTINFSGAQCRLVNGSGSSQSYNASLLRVG